ncbi:hexose kinase [Nocardia seriolae]|uniref:1-phosphofructokinase n=1 Tax=Nocardia seriolae TaxID=37332 RepID=A0ABC8AQE1_9NOCA|nr:hexose kinase [Nocardia seriolae]APA96378.1 1-phosphofructokinase [Nocardia seriolae]OJF78774.1 carbohydrate kinase [Nocardia seriolae]WNJ57952.1 hexose kinase [Nocardia seriolae]BEK98360.1 PfkB family carbohydrate kinase [Nocardia seriolae]GAM46470.1 carbohydrate kinase [Nocardia seriolae]
MSDVILTVTMNPAYDMTYRLERLEPGRAQRVLSVEQRLGGKGINVTRILCQLGSYSRATGFADHTFAAAAADEFPADFVPALPWVRRTVVISESRDGTATGLWEPGAYVHELHAVDRLRDRIQFLLPELRGLVVSGSLPGGIDETVPAALARAAVAAGVPTVCDVDGPALKLAAAVPGVILMPNRDELERLTGAVTARPEAVVAAARPLLDAGVGAVIATLGPDGMVAVTASCAWSATLPEPLAGNPTGAGDAAAAAVVRALATGDEPDWPAILTDAVATSAAAVVIPVAGESDLTLRDRLAPTVRVRGWSFP